MILPVLPGARASCRRLVTTLNFVIVSPLLSRGAEEIRGGRRATSLGRFLVRLGTSWLSQ